MVYEVLPIYTPVILLEEIPTTQPPFGDVLIKPL